MISLDVGEEEKRNESVAGGVTSIEGFEVERL